MSGPDPRRRDDRPIGEVVRGLLFILTLLALLIVAGYLFVSYL